MTDSEKLARWQGYKQHPNGVSCYTGELRLIGGTLKWPDYLNDDAAAMSLLDTHDKAADKAVELQLTHSHLRLLAEAVLEAHKADALTDLEGNGNWVHERIGCQCEACKVAMEVMG